MMSEHAATPVETDVEWNEPIAVIGLSCRLPGADALDAVRALPNRGAGAITDVPADRWGDDDAPSAVTRGGLLDAVGDGDATGEPTGPVVVEAGAREVRSRIVGPVVVGANTPVEVAA